jgi:hypothetical protein
VSHLWVKDGDGAWIDHPLDADFVTMSPAAPAPLLAREVQSRGSGPVLARARGAHGIERWVLLDANANRLRVNGAPMRIGARVLADRDAIALGDGCTVFFSSERLAQAVPFPGENDRTCCIRCKLPLEPGTPAVRCPAPECGFWHHQCDDTPCWTYTESCAGCGHPTALDSGFQWSPAEL